ncbi:MAG TPA: hypothetical protein VF172_00385 [Nitrososphaera sp.]|jgi:glutaredoxin
MTQSVVADVEEVRRKFKEARATYQSVLPKVDPVLVDDLLERLEASGKESLPYTIEVFTRNGVDTAAAKEYIISKTGQVPAIFDNGMHYVTNQKLTLEMLKEISDSPDVEEVHGHFCGGTGMRGAYFERRS